MTLDNKFILLIFFGILSLILKYLVKEVKHFYQTKEKISSVAMKTCIGENTSNF